MRAPEPTTHVVEAINALTAERGRPIVIGIDGRSASGKTTFAHRLAETVPSATVVHTDDIAWWHSHFDWVDVLVTDVLTPLLTGVDVSDYRPPGWVERERDGSLNYSPADVIIIEGVGSTQKHMTEHVDITVWIECDVATARTRGLERDTAIFGSSEAALADWESWQSAEEPFLEADRPWERAHFIVDGERT